MRVRKKKNCVQRMERCADLWVKNPAQLRGKWATLFGNNLPIHIEIGCGKGNFVTGMAALHPEINYVAIERVEDVIVSAMEKAIDRGIANIRFVSLDAQMLEEFFEAGEISRIYLNFSDPWPKKKHAKRRLTHKIFLDKYKRILRDGDYICFKTDNKNLFEFSLNAFAQENYKLENITFDLHNSDFEGNVMTEYEEKFSQNGMPIYRLEAVYLGWMDERGKK